MFTGIIEEIGWISNAVDGADSRILTIRSATIVESLRVGESVAVAGVCLTATDITATTFTADVMAETLQRTTLGGFSIGDKVNLERAVTVGARLNGHIVQGHVDGRATLATRTPGDAWEELAFEAAPEILRYLVLKGSIALDGTSLTVSSLTDTSFGVSLIPATLRGTTLGAIRPGDTVNVEVDVLAKYIERLAVTTSTADTNQHVAEGELR